MKKSKSRPRTSAPRRRLWASIAIVILVVVFATVTALMQGNGQRQTPPAAVVPMGQLDVKLEKALFVDKEEQEEQEREEQDQETLTEAAQRAVQQAAEENTAVTVPAIDKVWPGVFDGDVRKLPYVAQTAIERPENDELKSLKSFLPEALRPRMQEPNLAFAAMPSPTQNFAGMTRSDTCTGGPCGNGIPPDTNGDVGPNHYIQSVNTAVAIYNKTGTLQASFTFNSLWSGAATGTVCDTSHAGDPVVLYDSMADRWILSDLGFAFNAAGQPINPYYECIAVSKTADPVAGGWYLYAIKTDTGAVGQPPAGTLNDYPKFGIWTDCLYYSANGFANGASFNGVEFGSFSKADMYAGAALTGSLGFIAGTTNFAYLPANLSAPASGLPPAGSPNYYVAESATAFSWDVRKFTPGAHCGGGGTMSAATNVTQAAYTVPGTNAPQPNDTGSLHNLDSLGDRLMQKAQYRNIGGTESLWVVHTTRSSSSSNYQPGWAQLDVTGGTIAAVPVQQQIYAPDLTLYRWMEAIGVDKDGNMAIGYSTSNGTAPNFPSIAYSGRLVGDPLNQLPQTETQLVAGLGSQLNNCGGGPCHRWGDYSSMSIDPSDSCTFWLTTEYYANQTNGTAGTWNTRIGSFVFPSCVAAASVPTVPAAPTTLTFTSVAATAMTLNWLDNATNEDSYVVYRSTDNVNFVFAAQTAANGTSANVSGLNPSTTYFFKVYAAKNGALSTPLSGSQATTAATSVSSTGAGGLWSQTSTWASGTVPTANDNVTIVNGATVTIDIAAVALSVNVGTGGAPATLQFLDTSAQSLTVGQSVTVATNGTFQSAAVGVVTTHVLTVGTDLTNNGTINFSTAANLAGAQITFTGNANASFTLNGGSVTNLRQTTGVTLNKGTDNTPILTFTPGGTFTVQGANTAGFLSITNGTFKIDGSNTLSNPVFNVAGYTIPGPGGFWLNNPNFTVVAQNGTGTVSGLYRLTTGTFNVGTGAGSALAFASGSTIIIEGGALTSSGRVAISAAGNAINYTQTAGTITVCTVGNTSTTLGSFDLGTSLGSNVSMSGGTIIVQLASTAASGPRDFRNQSSTGFTGITGGTLQLGNAASGAAKAFTIGGILPNLVITNTSGNHTATMNLTLVNYNNGSRNVTLNTGTGLNLNNIPFFFDGTTLTNNGTLTHNGASSNFIWFLTTAPVTYTGSGTVTAPMTNFTMQADMGVTIDPVSPNIPVTAVRMFSGSVTNSNKITLGNGGATTGIVQIGNTTTPTNSGTFDVPFTFNLGTGGEVISYLRTTLTRTMGPEVTPTRTLTTFTYDDNDASHALTMAGGDLTVNGTTTLTNGRVITGASTFIIGSAGTIARTNGYIDGNLRKNYAVAASKVFEVGTANGFSPVTVNATAGTFPAAFDVKAIQGPQPNVNATTSIQRYWKLTNTTISSADLTFAYLAGDVMGTEASYKVIKIVGVTPQAFPSSTVNTGAHTASLTGATSFSDWTVGEVTAPTASSATISGHVATANGQSLGGVLLKLSGGQSAMAITDAAGNYAFENVNLDNFYTVTPALANYSFSPASRSFSLLGNHPDAVFTAAANAVIGSNAIDTNEYFVRQQYLDFLDREPDQGGFEYWSNEINQCGGDAGCISRRRIEVAAAFFVEREFQDTGSFVYRLYRASFGQAPMFSQFKPDRTKVVGGPNLDAAKAAFVNEFVGRDAFKQAYPDSLTPEQFLNKLFANAGLSAHTGDWDSYLAQLNNGHTRAQVLGQLIETGEFKQREYNPSFVLMEYFGYLQRDPDPGGYAFWLNVLENRESGNYSGMVCAFITSAEYQKRFSNIVTRSNAECGK